MEGRPGERNDEFLLGEQELPYTRMATYGGVPHYIISFNQKSDAPPAEILTSANAERLSDAEILAIIDNPPPEER